MGRLAGRVAVITGAARGIGAATAALFSAEGATVVLNDVDPGPLAEVADAIRRSGGEVAVAAGDAAEAAVADALIGTAESHGGLDILVNNAGTAIDASFHALTTADWARVYEASAGTTLAVTGAAVATMRRRATDELAADGRVAHQRKITSTVAASLFTGAPGQAHLSAAAGAVLGLTRTLARELGGFGINVNAVAPGFVDTRLTAPQAPDGGIGVPEPVRQMTKAMTALGRYGTPDDLARVHLFLASSDADFVTGAVIPVTGGLLGTFI